MSWLWPMIKSHFEVRTVEIAADLIRSGAFDAQIERVVISEIRKRDADLTRVGFVLKIAVELMDRSTPHLDFTAAKAMAGEVYRQFRRDNQMVKFGSPGWDWSGLGARTLAEEYEISYWETCP